MSLFGDPGGYERHLPAVFRADPFWARFLRPFEEILSVGHPPGAVPAIEGIEQTIARLPELLDPALAPARFLDWLASWVALSLREDWTEPTRRALIGQVVALYSARGTRAGLEAVINLYLAASDPSPPAVTILDPVAFQVGVHSTVGVDTWVGGGAPHYFTVRVDFASVTPEALELRPRTVAALVDREKPAHTYYDLEVLIPAMRVGVRSTVGQDTVLGDKLA